jgi:hypothetical protein
MTFVVLNEAKDCCLRVRTSRIPEFPLELEAAQ